MPPLVALLADVPIFEGVPSADVARVASAFSVRAYSRGDELSRPPGSAEQTSIVALGAVHVVRSGPDGRLLGVALLAEGGIFGALPFAASSAEERAEALCDSRVLTISTSDLERIAAAQPRVSANLLAEVGNRLAATTSRLSGLAFQSVPARLAASLLELAERFGRVTPRGVRIDLRLTHGQLAEMTSTTRETLTKVAGWLRAEGVVTLGRHEIWIEDPSGLEEVLRGERQMPGRGMLHRAGAESVSAA
jgi:CRP/FNR family transcriptional regulator